MARITLYGWLNYNPDLFKDIVVPEGIDKETLINEIIKTSGDLYTYHQAFNPLKQNIDFWFSRRAYDFEMMFKALRTEYNPLENYDRKEEIDRTRKNNGTDSTSSSSSATTQGQTLTKDTGKADGTLTDKVSAYNSTDFQNQSQTLENRNASNESNATNSATSSANATTETRYDSGYAEGERNRIHGNIGVTMAQDMILKEVEMRASLDLYKIIAKAFEKEFLVQIY